MASSNSRSSEQYVREWLCWAGITQESLACILLDPSPSQMIINPRSRMKKSKIHRCDYTPEVWSYSRGVRPELRLSSLRKFFRIPAKQAQFIRGAGTSAFQLETYSMPIDYRHYGASAGKIALIWNPRFSVKNARVDSNSAQGKTTSDAWMVFPELSGI